ncbi:hypothetical protein D3C77_796390 [compost metagenome]
MQVMRRIKGELVADKNAAPMITKLIFGDILTEDMQPFHNAKYSRFPVHHSCPSFPEA